MKDMLLSIEYNKNILINFENFTNVRIQYGNDYKTANNNWKNIHNPITVNMITTGEDIPSRIEEAIRSAAGKFLAYINIENVFTTQQDNEVNVSIEFSVPLNPDAIEILNFDFRIGD